MVSKNNRIKKMENVAERQSHFGIRKLTIGAASVLLGTTLWMSNGNVVQASDNGNDGNNGDHATDDSKTETPKITDDTKVVIEKSDDAAKAAQAQSQSQTNDNAQSQEAQADQNKVESSAVEKAQTESAQSDTSVQQTEQNTEKSAKSDKDQTTKDQVAENAKKALEVQKQKAETVTNSNSKTSTETINKEASAESAKQSSAQEATKAAESAESNVTKAIDNSNATLATTNEVAVAGQTLKTAGIQGNTNQKDAKSNDNTVNVDLSKLGVTGTTDEGIQKTSFAVKRLLSANTQNLESNEVNVQQFSPQALASLFTTSLVQTSGSGSNDATDIDTYTPNFNITENPEYQQYFAAIPADQYAFQSYEVVSTGQKIVVTTDKNDIGNNIRFYNVRNGSAQLVYQMTRDTQTDANGTVVREKASQQGTFTTAGVASNSTYKGGTYNWSLNQTNSVNFAGIGNLKIGRIDITAGNSNSPVDNGIGAFVTDDSHRITVTWDQGRPISDSIIPGKTWNSAGSNIPDKVTQNIWYVDAETGKVLSHKTSAEAFNGSSYDSTSNELKTITKGGKTYQLVARGSDGLYSSSDFSDILNKQLTTNNGVPITVGDLLSTPLKGILGDGRIGNIRASITNYQGTRSYTRLQTKTDGTIDLNTYRFDAGSTKGTLIPGLSQANVAPGQTVMGAHLADTGSGAFYNGTKPGNRDIIILYKAATPVANKQNANITFVNDDTGASLSPQQDATGDAGSQISFANAGTTVANLIGQGYIYNGTIGNGVTNGSASGSFTSVGFPVYDNDDNITQEFVVHFKSPVQTTTYHQGTTETKTVTRTINYYDKVTGEKIPSELIKDNPTTQNVTLSRTHVVSSTGKDMGYGSVSADGKTFTKAATADGWNTDDWAQVTSPDLSNSGYTAPDLAQADHVTVDANTKDAVVNVYYGHQTEVITPKTPHNPGGNINPNDPRNNPSVYPDGLTKEALTTEVTRKINYVGVNEDGTTTPVNGSPDGKSTYTQTVSFERNAVIDKVTGQILGYSTDRTTNVTTTDKDRAWTPTTQNMDSVASKTPSEVGYDKVDISTVGGITVYPGQKVNDVTVTYTKNKSPEVTQKATLEIIDNNDANAPKQLASFSNEGKSEDQITFANSNEILQSYLSQGYKVQKTAGNLSGDAQSGYTYPTYGNTAQDFKIYLIHDTEDKTETAQATAQVHYVVADNGVPAPADSDLQTITYTRTNKVDKVNGTVVTEGTWQADKNAFTDVNSPDLSKDGYTPNLATVQFNAPERNVNQRVTVVYNRSAQAADLQIIDDNDPQNQRVLATYSAGGESGKQISFDGSNTQLQNYLKNGYTFEKSEGQGMSGNAQNGFTYPSFDNDSNTNQSFKIYLKHATGEKKETATTTAHVHYIMADGTKAPDNSPTQTINWTRTNTVDQVTGAIVNEGTWSSDKNAFADVDSPAVTGYTPGTKTVKFATPERGVNQVVNVVYTKDAPTPDKQNALVVYQDVNDPAHPVDLGQSDQLTGQAGDSINYSTADKIAEYEKQGYVLVSNGFDANGTKPSFDNINGNTQTFYVTFKHGIQPVTPTTPGTPDQPINPDNPDGPKYPSGTDKTNLTKDVTRTVTYEGAGDKTPSPVTDTLHFQGTGYLDKVTGKWTDANGKELNDQTKGITWTITDGTKDEGSFNLVPTKHIDGYTSKVVTDGADDGNGNVKSYTGITHASDNINVVVQYNPIVAEQGNLIVKFHDDTDNKDLTGVGTDTGTQDVGTQVTYNPSTDLTNLENKGYVYVSTDGNIPSSIVKGTTTVTIHVKHGTVPVTPDNPGTPDKPINPNDPDGPKYPSGTDKASIDKTITRTVHYEGADQYTPNDVQQPVHFTAKGELDKVTGEWTTPLTWSADQTFNGVTTPKIPGYHVVSVDKDTTDNQNVDSAKISHTGADYTVTVKYAKDAAPTPDTTTGKVTYIDDTAKTTLKTDSLSGNVDANIDYTTQDKINNYINMGYKLVSNNFTDGKEVFNKDASKNNFEVHLVHDTVPVTPDNPGTPDQPINPNDPRPKDEQPKYPTGTDETDLTKEITRTVHYEGADQYTPNDVQQPVHFTAKGVLDKVTGEWTTPLTWSADQTFKGVTTPKIPGYHVVSVDKDTTDNQNVDSAKISHTGANYTVTVKYAKDDVPTPIKQGTIEVIYHDTTDNVDIPGYGRTQTKEDEGTSYSYNPNDKDLPALENKGYVLDGELPTIPTKYTDGDQRVVINVKHGTRPVTPENPANPTDPVDPQHPGTPTPSNPNLSKTDLEKSITRTVKYQYADDAKAHDDSVQTVDFKGQGIIDLVTGNLVNVDKDGNIVDQRGKITWDHDSQEFGNVDAINHDGYYVSNVSETNTSAQVTDTAVAKETVTPSSQNSTIVITLTKNPEAPKTQQNAQLTIRDVTPGQEQDLGSYTQPGLEGDAISFGSAQEFVQNLLNKGYVWDGASYNGTNLDATNYAGINFGNYDNTDDKNNISQKWVINLVHGVTPVNPDHPDDKDGYTKEYLDRTITRDVTYVDEQGKEMPGLTPEHQEAKFQGSGYLDNVTGKWVTVKNGKITGLAQGLTWTPDKDANFDAIGAKTADGYHVISVSGNGISGFTVGQDGSVTAQTVNKDTPSSTIKVVYAKTPVTPVPANGSIVYIDDTTGTTLENANFGGNVGDKINYTTADRIANYEKKGYDLVSNNFKDGQEVFTNGENKFEVHLVHATTPITPENPGKPGQEVPNPNDPNNPHTIPDNFVPQTLTKTVTRDVTYVYEDGSQAEAPVHQTFTFNGNGIVDLVTGQLVTVENGKITGAGKITWNADKHEFEATKVIDTTQYNIVKVSENNTSANVDMNNGVVASETINPNSQNSKVVITLAKKEAPTPADQTVVGKQVVHYVDEQGNKLRDDNTNDTFVFTKPGKTGQWNETSHKYADANAVVIDGYVSEQKTYEGQTATPEDANKEITIVYHKIGKIIPVDPSGNPIPDAPTPGYHNDPTDPTKVTPNEPTPNVPGWTTDVPNVTPEVPTKDTPVPYTKNPDTPVPANGSIVYIDDTTGNTLENATFSGNVGDKINYTTADRITNYTNKGYNLVSNNFKDGNETFAKDGNKFEVHFVHDTVPVTPTDPGKPGEPINPNDPDGPKYPDGTSQTDLTKTVTRTINYVGDGLNIPASHTEIEFTGSGVLDKVTGQWTTPLTWMVKGGDSDSGNFEQVDGPKADGYYITNISSSNEDLGDIDSTTGTVASKTINHTNGNIVIIINYAKKPVTPTPVEKGTVIVNYVDKTTGNTLETATSTGNEGSNVNYSTKDTVTKYTNRGYKLSHDGYPTGNVTYTNGTQTYTVEFVHDTVPVTPTDPGKPGQPINPNDPNGPKYPDGTSQTDLTKTVTRTINYVGDGLNIPASHTEIEFTGSGVLDKVTGQWTTPLTWTVKGGDSDSGNFEQVDGPKADGYYITNISSSNEDLGDIDSTTGTVASKTINHTNGNIVITINYAKKPVTPTPVEKGTVIINYVDKTTGKTLETATSTGNEGSNVNYSTKDTITKYTNQGYKLSHDGYPTGNVTYTNGTQTYTVEFVHDTVPVTPTDPGKPGQPINPNDPDGPKYPDGSDQVTKTVTRTINYVGDGLNIPASHTEIEFTGSGVLDKVTGQWTTPLTWTVKGGNSDSGNFEQVDGPKADGYYITNISSSNEDLGDIDSTTGTVASKTINHANGNIVITINYAKKTTPTPGDVTVVGKQVVHYVDEQGNKLRDDNTNDTFVFTKPGKTGQWNETSHKYADANAVVIDGYVSDQKTYTGQTATPEDANKEITIVYHKIGKIIPVDPSGNPIPDAPTPGYHNDPNDPSKVTPNEPTPNIPGWTTNVPNVTPEVPTKDTNVPYTKNTPTPAQGSVTIVVHDKTTNTDLTDYGYTTGTVDEGSKVVYDHDKTVTDLTNKGYKLVQDIAVPSTVDGSNKTLTMIVEHDTVTITPDKPGTPGQPINPNDPNGPKWDNGTDAKSLTKTGTQTVHYQGAGNQTPQDNVSTVKFEHSITYDRVTGKVVKDNGWTSSQTYETVVTPTVDGYTPDKTNVGGETVSVDQNGNGDIDKSYVVTYTKNQVPTPTPTPTPEPQPTPETVNGKQTITFVDGDNGNTPLRDPDVQTHKFTNGESSYTFGTINVPVIDGYVAEVKTAGGKTVTPANPDANVTVVYHKIGKIVPVDPDHNPIPGADQPSYHNDPTDPTKVVPDEPVPTIDGYTPDQDSVTPVDPTKDTEVVYRKKETPKKPETPKTPEEPTTPEEPKKPATPKKENNKPKPTTPKPTPNYNNNIAPHSQSGYWNNNIAPHATSVNGWTNNIGPHGETVDANGNIVAPNGEIIGYVDANGNPHYTKSGEKSKTLPQTGEKTNEAAAVLGGLSAGLGLIGLAGVKKRRRKED